MATLELKDVRKSYGAVEVIHGVNVEIKNGEFVVLVGPSGCGKSTLLRMIAGLEEITDGTIAIQDRIVNDLEPKHRDIAMVFQNYALYPHLTVARNMGFSLRMRRERKDVIDAKVRNAAQILGLAEYLDRLPRQLSGGQRQRVAMGRAIVRDPQVFLFDEPLSNLDAQLRVQMRTEIKDMHQRLRTTTIYVTHDQIEAMTMADKIVVLRDGIVEQIGSPLELYERPANAFVASFIGSPAMNILTGTVRRTGDRLAFASQEGIELPLPEGAALGEGKPIRYGVRPEHLVAGTQGTKATAMLVEPMGSETQVTLEAGGAMLVAMFRDRTRIKRGNSIRLSVNPEEVHLFEGDSQTRIAVPRDHRSAD